MPAPRPCEESPRHVAGAGRHIEHADRPVEFASEHRNDRPEHARAIGNTIDTRESGQGQAMLGRIDGRIVHQLGNPFAPTECRQECHHGSASRGVGDSV